MRIIIIIIIIAVIIIIIIIMLADDIKLFHTLNVQLTYTSTSQH